MDDLDVNLHYYGARMYDPAIARFTGVDPIAEKFAFVSGFNYAENKPINSIDLHGLQAVFFQVAGRIGIGAPLGSTTSTAFGIAADGENFLVYNTTTVGVAGGAFAGAGFEVGINFNADNVDELLGWGASAGIVSTPTLGPTFGAELNMSLETEWDEGDFLPRPTFEDGGFGLTVAPPAWGLGVGFLAYFEGSWTSEIAKFNIDDIGNALNSFVDQFSGTLSEDEVNSFSDQLKSIQEQSKEIKE